jgi:hypothetical protein
MTAAGGHKAVQHGHNIVHIFFVLLHWTPPKCHV